MELQNVWKFIIVVLLFIFSAGLLTTDFFYDPTSFAYYGFCIITFSFVIISSFFYLRGTRSILFKTPIIFFSLWSFYIFFQYFNNSAISLFTIYFLALYLLLICSTIIFSLSGFKFSFFYYGIIILSTIESLYCILQFIGICKSHSVLFPVTGSYNNPNVTAIFLALTTPVFLYLFRKKHNRLIGISFLILLIALFLLKCRAALIGVILSTVVFYVLEYNMISWIKQNRNKPTVQILAKVSIPFR